MNVARLELCKELYELSGWETKEFAYFEKGRVYVAHDDGDFYAAHIRHCPAYDLGYLLRKLPIGTNIFKNTAVYAAIGPGAKPVGGSGVIPEDALVKLAIELFKQEILKRDPS